MTEDNADLLEQYRLLQTDMASGTDQVMTMYTRYVMRATVTVLRSSYQFINLIKVS